MVRRSTRVLAFAAVSALGLALPSPARAGEEGIARVVLNGIDRGDHRFVVHDGGVFLLPEDLRSIGFSALPWLALGRPGAWVDTRGYFPPVFFDLDSGTSTLVVRADPTLLDKHVVDLAVKRPSRVSEVRDPSASLNYGVTWSGDREFQTRSVTTPLELSVGVLDWAAVAEASYAWSLGNGQWRRGMTSLVHDDPARRRRFVAGDTFAAAGTYGGALALGGLQYSTRFLMTPLFVKSPGLDVSGLLRSASDVELYVNDLLIRKEHFPPGEFEFRSVPNVSGAADVTVVIRDAFGRETRVTDPTYLSNQVLKTGLHEFSYAAGFRRDTFGAAAFDYGRPAFLAFHRAGLSRRFTAGVHAEADERTVNAGPTATVQLGMAGDLDLFAAWSRGGAQRGRAAALAYGYGSKRFGVNASFRAASRDYARLDLPASSDKARLEASLALGYRNKTLGAFAVGLQRSERYQSADRVRMSFLYSRKIGRRVSLLLAAARNVAEETRDEVWASLLFQLWGTASAATRATWQEDTHSGSIGIQDNAPAGPGFGYRLNASSVRDGPASLQGSNAQGSVEYRGPFGVYRAEGRRVQEEQEYGASAAGAITLIDETIHLSRPIRDGFALVSVGNLRNVLVKLNNQDVGRTGMDGVLLVPNLNSYYDENLSLEDSDLPPNYAIDEPARYVSVKYRRGGLVGFTAKKLQAFTARLVILDGSKRIVPELWGLELEAGGERTETVVGRRGELYLENVPSGRHRARTFTSGGACAFDLEIPASEEMMVDLGEVTCAMR